MSDTATTENPILTVARSLAGESADETVLSAMCTAAADALEARLRAGETPEALGAAFQTAAGILAVSMYCAVGLPVGIRSFSAGKVSVSYGGEAPTPERLRAAAEELLAAHLQDRGFDFTGVSG